MAHRHFGFLSKFHQHIRIIAIRLRVAIHQSIDAIENLIQLLIAF